MKKTLCLALLAVALTACNEDDKSLPTEPGPADIGFSTASFTWSRSEDSVACTYRLLASWTGGNPPVVVSWRSASSRFPGTIGGDRIDIVINKSATVVSEAATIEMTLKDSDDDTTTFTQGLTFTCNASSAARSVAGPQFSWFATGPKEPDFLPTNWNM